MKRFTLLLLSIISLHLVAQFKPIGSWTDHLPYQYGTSLDFDGTNVICGTRTGVFLFNKHDNSIQKYSTVNRLSDVNVGKLKYNPNTNSLIVIYSNGNIDIIENTTTSNLPYLKENASITNKNPNDITIHNEFAYISFPFGIVKINMAKKEISDTYRFGSNGSDINVNTTEIIGNSIIAGTDLGYVIADLNTNLLDFTKWVKQQGMQQHVFKDFFWFSNSLYAIRSVDNSTNDSVFVFSNSKMNPVNQLSDKDYKSVYVENNVLTIATHNSFENYDNNLNLVSSFNNGNGNVVGVISSGNKVFSLNTFDPLVVFENNTYSQTIKPNGPFEKDIFEIDASGGIVYAVPGGHDISYNSQFKYIRIYKYYEGSWTSFINFYEPSIGSNFDALSIAINPNDAENAFIGTWGTGLVETSKNPPFNVYSTSNSSLVSRTEDPNWVGVGGLQFDDNGNLWMSNVYNNTCLSVKKANGSWKNFNFAQHITNLMAVKDVLIDNAGNKWISVVKENKIIVFDDKGTIDNTSDDRSLLLSQQEGKGNIPGIIGLEMEKDLDGNIWLGTDDGVAVFFSPENIFTNSSKDAQRILIDDGKNVEVLLSGVKINDIAIDGANRKWLATENSGVYLLSADGTEEIHHFTTANSPLYSNTITSIAVEDESGEVFIGTSLGIISYRGTSTAGKENFKEVKIFPNPVKPENNNQIAISGLIANSTIKITDISGFLVTELKSIGGQAIWDGNNLKGEKVSTGVYLVFYSGENSESNLKEAIGKVLFIK